MTDLLVRSCYDVRFHENRFLILQFGRTHIQAPKKGFVQKVIFSSRIGFLLHFVPLLGDLHSFYRQFRLLPSKRHRNVPILKNPFA